MPYTPPNGDALSFSWQGETPYTPPAGDALTFSFVPTGGSNPFGDLVIPVTLTTSQSGDLVIPVEIETIYQSGDLVIPVELSIISIYDALPNSMVIPVMITTTQSGDMVIPVEIESAFASGDMVIPVKIRTSSSGDMVIPVQIATLGISQKWRKGIVLGGVDVSVRLMGEVVVEKKDEGSARIAEFVLSPTGGIINPYAWVGAEVIIDHIIIEGEAEIPQREFYGVVHLPEYNTTDRSVRFTCTDNLQNKVANLPREVIDYLVGGRYDVAVQGEQDDNWQYAQARMETVAGSLDASPTGALRVTLWDGLPVWKTYDLTNTFDGSIDFTAPQRTGIINRIDATFEYRFSRLHRATASIRYAIELRDVVNNMLPLLSRSTVESALESTGWEFYYGGDGRGANGTGNGGGIRSGIFGSGDAAPLKKLIDYVPYPEIYYFPPPSNAVWYQNESDTTCMEFSCRMYKRWNQPVTETYPITVLAPESIVQNGEMRSEERASLASRWDAGAWESDALAKPELNATGSTQVLDYSPDATPAQRDSALQTVVEVCRVKVLGSHRSARGKAVTWLTPQIDVDKSIYIDSPRGTAKGKVVSVRHVSNLDTGSAITEFEIAPSGHGAIGLPEVTPTPVVAPEPPAVVTVSDDWQKQLGKSLGAHIGGLASSPEFEESWEGWNVNVQDGFAVDDPGSTTPTINPDTQKTEREKVNDPYSGNSINPAYVPEKAYTKTGFRIVLPGVEDTARDAAAPIKTATYEVPIPVDEFTLSA